jgi:uncharacterized protein
MDVYLDASVLVSLLTVDTLTLRARALLTTGSVGDIYISDFAAAEATAVIARDVRTRNLTEAQARAAFNSLDRWTSVAAKSVLTTSADIAAATAFTRRLDLVLRAPDAIHIAIAQRLDIALATFDTGMAASATALGVSVAQP